MGKRFEMRIPDETRAEIGAIRRRLALQSDAQAVIYAVHQVATGIGLADIPAETFETLPTHLKSKARFNEVMKEATKSYTVARADKAKPVAAIRLCSACQEPLNSCTCPAPPEVEYVPDAQ